MDPTLIGLVLGLLALVLLDILALRFGADSRGRNGWRPQRDWW